MHQLSFKPENQTYNLLANVLLLCNTSIVSTIFLALGNIVSVKSKRINLFS